MRETRTPGMRITWSPEEGDMPRARQPAARAEGAGWLALYVAVALSPLVVLLIADRPAPRSFWTELSVALAFVGMSVMCLQFALTARFRHVAPRAGIDIILQFHRQISFTALALVLAHPLILVVANHPRGLALLNPVGAPPRVWFGLASALALLALMGLSLGRRRLKLNYEAWKLSHGALAVVAVVAGLAHMLSVGHYLDLPWKRGLWDAFALGLVGLLLYTRLGKPIKLWRRPYEVARVEPERGNATTVVLKPVGHRGLRFRPGQFAWVRLGRSPFSLEEHPFSFSSSAERRGEISLTIKALGDFTRTAAAIVPGTRAYLDGPFGAFEIDRLRDAPGFVLVAGGVGITPMMSILATMADRGDTRPVLLLYASRDWESVTFREALEALAPRLNLQLVHVLDKPPEQWTGERGFISPEVLARHLGADRRDREYLLCGPPPMMAAVERTLLDLGVPHARIHAEKFNLV